MPDEVSIGELARRFDRIEQLLVSRNELTLALEHLQSQLADLKDEVKELRAEKSTTSQGNRAVFLGAVSAVIVAIVVAAVSAWVTGKGGH